MSEIIYKGAAINYEVTGSGYKTPFILLHGFLEDRTIWQELVNVLRETRKVICIDLPGHGRSGCFADIHSMAEMAEIVKLIAEEQQLEYLSIAGHSMGGYVGLEFLNKFPMLLKSIVLINSTPEKDSEERMALRDRAVRLAEENKSIYVSMAICNLFTSANRKRLANEINVLKKKALEMKTCGITGALKGMKNRTDHSGLLKEWKGTKLIMAGKLDPVLCFNNLERISRECKANFIRLENGHMAYLEDKKQLIDKMRFID